MLFRMEGIMYRRLSIGLSITLLLVLGAATPALTASGQTKISTPSDAIETSAPVENQTSSPERVRGDSEEAVRIELPITSGTTRIDLSVRFQNEVVMSQFILPRADQQTVRIFSHPVDPLKRLMSIDARSPGRVSIEIRRNGEPLITSSLTEFISTYRATGVVPVRSALDLQVASDTQCEDNCWLLYSECTANCDPMGSACSECERYYDDCRAACPDCDDWDELSRTLVGREYTGGTTIIGLSYCNYTEYYVIEETNPAGCYPNRYRCVTDDDMIFHGTSSPTQTACCWNSNPSDDHYCGGEPCS
jgi:hypothetical protein